MNKIIIYGLGKRFEEMFKENEEFWTRKFEIVCVCDKNYSGATIFYANKDIPVVKPEQVNIYSYDYIIVTTNKFFDEIKEKLIDLKVEKDKIKKINNKEVWEIILGDIIFDKCIDIGGPSSYFIDLYNKSNSIDIFTYIINPEWREKLKGEGTYSEQIRNIIIGDSLDLSCIESESYDLVLSSHTLEHIANPIKALLEWKRILKTGGVLILVIPNQKYCFDHARECVTTEHLLEDYKNNVLEDDLTHIEEIVRKTDLPMLNVKWTEETFRAFARRNFKHRELHHHVFSKEVLVEMADYMNMKVVYTPFECSSHIICLRK